MFDRAIPILILVLFPVALPLTEVFFDRDRVVIIVMFGLDIPVVALFSSSNYRL